MSKSIAKAKSTDSEAALSPKMARFVEEYLIDSNGTQAAIRAGYSPKTANEQAARLLAKVSVRSLLDKRRQELMSGLKITQERVLQEVARLAFLDIRKAFDESGNLKPLHELDDDTAAALAGLDVFEEYVGRGEDREHVGNTKKIKLSDKKGALELLMRHLGMLNDKVKLQGDPANPIQVAARIVMVPPKVPAEVIKTPIKAT